VFVAPGHTRTATTGADNGNQTPFGNLGQGGFGQGGYLRRGTSGTVESVHGTTLTLLNRQGQPVTVTTSPDTLFTKTVVGSVRDVRTGETIVASGVLADATDTLTAGRIAVLGAGPAPGARPPGTTQGGVAIGQVTADAGDSLSVTNVDGTSLTVVLAPSTVVTRTATGSLADLRTGEQVAVRGIVNPDGSVTASMVQQGGGPGVFGGGGFGQSTSSGSTGATSSFGRGSAQQP
jgi:hypothetical protein